MDYKRLIQTASFFALSCCINQSAHASSYKKVHDIVFNQAQVDDADEAIIQAEKSVYLAGELPAYKVTSKQFTKQVKQRLAKRAKQTLTDEKDYYDRLEKLVHSNGICMAGTWYITEQPKNANNESYTGLFAQGAISPFIGRLSVALSETKQGEPQGFGMAGKLFGDGDINKDVITENFFVADVLSGTYRNSVFDAPMTNKPKAGFRFNVIGLGLKIAPLFNKADKNAGMRPVTGIAKMGMQDSNQKPVSPKFMKLLSIQPDNYHTDSASKAGIDFRDEFALHAENVVNGDARYFAIYVSDTASQPTDKGWQHIGFIKADETIVSYGCDRQLHFNHPKS